ncbi:MinD superfamily P-loop ATPase, contains an inserted ferredoxin domain [Paucidesulfovibrio gracilis DSM 16080]|uniref:MinD superfamily P-loop ATPase, contains an inserted ferredoxin domain n=1 Tax=Paucidesulfovibrio gracilis DSM 16080 TaxID=1121449 RepID=A0A1T4WKX7_9BACT|nr:ATP-binding protein [Paucidesulfovibrio gracilis]SKA77555.1 MinD superfamily P-loop ATPase, contains an inserted ferredoxin domain [Paucidesulfovibrio gracilis DSM 16080]
MKQLVVISGKGGTGKTSVTAALAGLGPDKVLADCDVDAADLHLVLHPTIEETTPFVSGEQPELDPAICTSCGLCREHCRFDAINEDFQIMPEHCEGCGVCAYVCPVQAVTMHPRTCGEQYRSSTRFGPMIHAALGIGEENSGKLVTSVRQQAKEVAEEQNINLVLVDGSPGVGCPVIASLTDADLAVMVAEPTISAVHDLKRVHQLTQHFKMPSTLIINKSGINPELEEELRQYCASHAIPVLGALPYDDNVTKAQINGQTIYEYDPDGLGRSISSIWNSLESLLND